MVAGSAGRNPAATTTLGVTRPTGTPALYCVSADHLTLAESIQVPGGETSGEMAVSL
ncbi:MAG: DUF2848 family protein [Rhodospirillales bacterium]|nr:DUF2848 family protein [Rhodospirillales bacterium]